MILRRCQPSETREVMAWIKARHYLRSTPPGCVAVVEFLEGKERVGAAIIGRPSARSLDADRVLELNRLLFVDQAPKNTESRALGMIRAFVRKWFQGVRLLISYSDPAQGHTGCIYEADGWAPFGKTTHKTGYGWRSRPNRSADPVTPKTRWVRTP